MGFSNSGATAQPDQGQVTVVIADDSDEFRMTLAEVVSGEPTLSLAGAASDTAGAMQLAVEHQPDVVVLDLDMPGGGGWRAAAEIVARCPRTGMLALTALDTPETRFESARAGITNFLPKGSSSYDIIEAIHKTRPLDQAPSVGRPNGLGAGRAAGGADQRLAQLEARVTSLEQSMIKLLSR